MRGVPIFAPSGRLRGVRLLDGRLAKDVSMTKLTLGSHPYLLGFEQLERLLERSAKSGNEGYPPFNIEQTSPNSYRITLAVAGFSDADLSITVEDRQLVIRGRQSDAGAERVFLHRGIAARQFQRSFVLADGVEVGEAIMENGLLHVDLRRIEPEPVVQRVKISRG
jgi:HSP20 family molecular chaperone IbpA